MDFIQAVFWLCFGLLAYIYVGYFLCTWLSAAILRRDVTKSDIEPTVTVVIAAFNEEREIESTIQNKLTQEYPPERLQVLVVSDGSTDRTDDIVQRLADQSDGRVKLLRQEPRQGKTQALNMAVQHVRSDIIVFADANSIYAPDAVHSLVRNFADPSVGYVTGQMIYTNPGDTGVGEGCSKYMSYENALRTLETRLGSIVGVDGGIDAVRSELYVSMRSDQLPDFVLPMSVVEQGKRVVYDSNARVYEAALANATDEFRMRVRVSLRALWALYDKRLLLNPIRYPMFAWQLLSHKVLRYCAFVPLFGLFVSNFVLASGHPFYFGFLALQLAAYGSAALGHGVRRTHAETSKLLLSYYFVIVNAACGMACWKLLSGERIVLWTPRQGGG
jgi:cellulose synthase/poly-beta-1,6-N-acetylglucosamine synthase-like glycosyltransferase